ncbi:MAG: ATP-binding protein [Clostridiales bacterium]|jgi:signal transduction histidine kinase|nr:ATP-binding protein [Eubacteriales bacterium]MDH7567424.1 ATP-binding protein [Clostridiales bacterium]
MKYSLRAKLSISYIFIALMSVLFLSVLANIFLDRQFKEYVINKQEQISKDTVNLITQQYKGDGKWNGDTIEKVGINALEQGLIIKVKDASGKTVWDATVHNNGLCTQMLSHMAQNMMSRYPNWRGGYVEASYPVKYNFEEVGSVEIGYFGPYYFNDSDLAFINTLNKMLIGVGVFSLFFALILGTVMARRISHPISRVIKAAQMISKGYYGERISEKSSTKEIGQLTSTINELADTLEKQEILRKRMSADVAHELRTPLATLQSHMEAMVDGIWKPDAQRLKSCHEEIMRIGRLVGDLEKLARYEGENLYLNKTRFELSELIQSIIHNFENDFRNNGIEIKLEAEEQLIFADRDKISQVVINLLSNSLKYTPEGGRVEVYVKGTEEMVEMVVKDNGQGIPEEDLPYIFERFYRADKSRNRLTGGSGIGLTIAKALVEAHKGKIWVRSKLNVGTEVMVSLPKQVN